MSEVVGVLLMLAIVVSIGVILFTLSSSSMNGLSQGYAGAMSNKAKSEAEKFAIEQAAFTVSGSLAIDGTSTNQAGGSSSSIAATWTTASATDVVVAYISPADTGATAPPAVSGITGGGLTWNHRVTTPTETFTADYYVPVSVTNNVGTGLAIDGHNKNMITSGNPTSIPVTLTTTKSPDLIVVFIKTGGSSQTVSGVSDTSNLIWTQRAQNTLNGARDFEEWYAVASSALTGDTITASVSAATSNLGIVVFGVSGANTVSPFDSNPSLPADSSTTSPGTPSASGISTSNANDMIVFGMATGDTVTETAGSGFTIIDGYNATPYTASAWAEQEVVSAPQSSVTVSFGTALGSSTSSNIADAIQATATPNPFQQQITWNPSTYTTYEASDLGNVRFCSDSGCATPLNGWLESCTPSCTPSATSATAWVKLTTAIQGNGGTLMMYMVFLQPTSTEFDGNHWGEAPNLSGTYGQYDNGANVFNFYDNFAGTSLSGKWTAVTSGGGSVTVNNGATFTTSAASDYAFVASATQAYPSIAEAYMVSESTNVDPMMGVTTSTSANSWVAPYNGYSIDDCPAACGGPGLSLDAQLSGGGTVVTSQTESFNAGIWQVVWSGTGTQSGSDGSITLTATDATVTIANYGVFVGQSNAVAGSNVARWARMRAFPPSNVMPSVSFGSIGSTTSTFDLEEWYATTTSVLSSATITATLSSTDTAATWIAVFGISGANTASPFDSNPANPATAAGASNVQTSVSTSNPNDLLLFACSAGSGSVPGGFTTIYSNAYVPFQNQYVGDEAVSTKQSSLAVSCGGANTYGTEITDAVQAFPGGADLYVRNVGNIPTTLVSVYATDLTSGASVLQTTVSYVVNVGTFVEIPHSVLNFPLSHGHTYLFVVASSLGNSAIYSEEAT